MRILQPLLNVSFTFSGNVSHWHEHPTFHALKVMTSTSLLYLLPHYKPTYLAPALQESPQKPRASFTSLISCRKCISNPRSILDMRMSSILKTISIKMVSPGVTSAWSWTHC